MAITLIFLGLLMGTIVWWLIKQTINTQPWAEEGVIGTDHAGGPLSLPAKKIGLIAFIAVATSLFMLFFSAYNLRMDYPDWVQLSDPKILWLNTALLFLASIFYQLAKTAAQRSNEGKIRVNLVMAGVFTFCFLAGQLWAWQQMHDQGLFLHTNPAYAFFYVLTGVHAIHILGGLWVWARSTIKAWSGVEAYKIRTTVELCTLYWHFLLLIWLIMFYLLLET